MNAETCFAFFRDSRLNSGVVHLNFHWVLSKIEQKKVSLEGWNVRVRKKMRWAINRATHDRQPTTKYSRWSIFFSLSTGFSWRFHKNMCNGNRFLWLVFHLFFFCCVFSLNHFELNMSETIDWNVRPLRFLSTKWNQSKMHYEMRSNPKQFKWISFHCVTLELY